MRIMFVIGDNPTLSVQIQRKLFEKGYSWIGRDTEPKYTDSLAITVDTNYNNLAYLNCNWEHSNPFDLITDAKYFTDWQLIKDFVKVISKDEAERILTEKFGQKVKIG